MSSNLDQADEHAEPARHRRRFGRLKQLASGQWHASYVGPDGQRHNAPKTFTDKSDGDRWLNAREIEIQRGEWGRVLQQATQTVKEYAEGYLARHRRNIKHNTFGLDRRQLAAHVYPYLGDVPTGNLTPIMGKDWWATVAPGQLTARQGAYARLRKVCIDAVERGVIPSNPVSIKGAGSKKARKTPTPQDSSR